MLAWTDTVWVEGETRILVQFDNPSSNSYPFIFGASISYSQIKAVWDYWLFNNQVLWQQYCPLKELIIGQFSLSSPGH